MFIFPEFGCLVIVGLMILVPVYLIYKKAGFNPAWGLLVFFTGIRLINDFSAARLITLA
ncbi:hypothetical protein [Bathymodiolus japonicus methanotrophic gill symbiont]|uniref:hypothetical protein n=1 Tax=Bathymodiolus japonicus methanotrophic gill symbiont TaxID=113269 RepID=UPI00308403C2